MERTLKIFLSCSFGAGIGAMVALGVNHYFWWLGLIVGGLTGYLSYEFKKVVEAAAEGYKRVAGYKPNKEYWKIYGLMILVDSSILLTVVSIIIPLMFSLISLLTKKADFMVIFFLCALSFAFTLLFIMLRGVLDSDERLSIKQKAEHYVVEREKLITQLKEFNFLAVYFYWLPRGIIEAVKKIPKIVLFLARFVKTIFLLIHSDIRLLCGMDAAIGAGIGYFTASVVAGMFIGGILGVIQYEIVSKRLLHLNAKTT